MSRFKLRKFTKIVSLTFCVAIVIAACARKEIKLHAVSYNKAISDYGNKQILLNAVRASKNYPMYFSAVGDMTGGGILNGGATTSFPFKTGPGNKLPSFNINPSVNYSSGLKTINIANLNTKEFQEGISNELDAKLFKQFLQNNWSKDILFNVLIHKIILSQNSDENIGRAAFGFCVDSRSKDSISRDYKRCARLATDWVYLRENCPEEYEEIRAREGRYFNSGNNKCDQLMFQIYVSELRLLGFGFGSEKTPGTGEFYEQKKTEKRDGKIKLGSVVYSEKIQEKKRLVWKIGTKNKYSYLNKVKINVELRSPKAMVAYLGSLIRAQLYNERRFNPTIVFGGDFLRVPLFEVRRGTIGRLVVRPAISVMHEGADYYIPRPKYGSAKEARSLQVMNLINQVIVLQTKKTDLPKSSTIQLIGG